MIPVSRKNEVLSFIRTGLRDFSISRPVERSGGWGIPVPYDSSQIIYVWIDALTNYLSGLGYPQQNEWAKFWNEESLKIHVIGKNVWKFHAVYWPALLLSAGLSLPDEIIVHGFLTQNGQKISKSSGNNIDPIEFASKYGCDAIRYYLLAEVSPFNDSDFSIERFRKTYQANLANNLGNLVNRLIVLCEKADYETYHNGNIKEPPKGYKEAIEKYQFKNAIEKLWQNFDDINRDIESTRPWKQLKNGNHEPLKAALTNWLQQIENLAHWLSPFLPVTSRRISSILTHVPLRASKPLFPGLPD